MNNQRLLQELALERLRRKTRRHFLRDCASGLGAAWLASSAGIVLGDPAASKGGGAMSPRQPPGRARARRVIYLHMAGAPSQLELYDYKPELRKFDGQPCPKSFLKGQQFAFLTGIPNMLGPQHPFHQAGESGAWISDQLPNIERVIDEICFVKSMHTTQFNHAPAQLLMLTGNQNLGFPSVGAWAAYGLGTENQNLPGYIVLVSGGHTPSAGKAAWGPGFLPSVYQGVQCRSQGDPVLYLSNPKGVSASLRRKALDALGDINRQQYQDVGDPETLTRIEQYEMAFRMQMHASDAFDLTSEPESIHKLYGTNPGKESFANNCLLARRLAERDVRFIQLFHWGWDSHGSGYSESLHHGFKIRCKQVDQPIYALLSDLKQRGLLEDTLVVWAGEFGRTPMRENRGGAEGKFVGRDHNPNAFTIWMAGGGVKGGMTYGATDEMGYRAVENPVSIRDYQATLLQLLGFPPGTLTYPFQGLNQSLMGVTEPHRVIKEIFA